MSRRSSRSSKSTRWHSTAKLAPADISLVFADSIQVSSSPGAAAATLPRQSALHANDRPSDMNTLDNDKAQDIPPSRFSSPRFSSSSNSLLSSMYSGNKRRQNSPAISRIERVIQQPELYPSSKEQTSNAEVASLSNSNSSKPGDSVGSPVTKHPISPKQDAVILPTEPKQVSPVNPVVVEGGVSEQSVRLHDESLNLTKTAALPTETLHTSENHDSSRSYISNYLFPSQIPSSGSERESKHEAHSEAVPSPSIHTDKKFQVVTEEVSDGVLPEPSSEKPAALPSTTWSSWSDYLRFPTSVMSGSRPYVDTAATPVSPKPEVKQVCSDVEAVSPTLSHDGSSSWFTWAWWRSNPQSNTTMGPISAAVHPEMESAQRSSRTVSPEPINPIGASRETKAGWLSVLASTSARRRAVMEKGETMEVVIVDDEIVDQTRSTVLDDTRIHPDSQSSRSSVSDTRKKRDVSAVPSTASAKSPLPDFLLLPTFEDTFSNPPRSNPLPKEASTLHRTVNYVAKILFSDEATDRSKGKERELSGKELPKAWSVLGEDSMKSLSKINRVVVVGIHGWFPGAFIRQVLGEPTGTSEKFANMLEKAVCEYFDEHGVVLEKVTKIILQGEGTVAQRVNSLFQDYLSHEDWVNDLQTADAILFGTHSQGSLVTTQIVNRLIEEGHIRTSSSSLLASLSAPQHVGILALCGVHNGPFLHLNTNYLMNPYIQYFESAAARELFEFQDSDSPVSKTYVAALSNCLHHGVKFTYIASLNDQVVPIYSGAFMTATHPLILRALYIDGDAYHSTDFLSNLLILLFKIRNAGLHDSGLIAHLSEATAGSLTGVGHSKAYEASASYRLALRFLFETSGVIGSNHDLIVEPFTARAARNDYEIPWALRDLIADPDVAALFSSEFSSLRTAFDEWHPRTAVLRDIRRKLEPIRRLNTARL